MIPKINGYLRNLPILLMLVLVSLTSCTGQATQHFASASVVQAIGGGSNAAFAHATQPQPFTFPLDHGPHPAYRTEWW